MTTRTRRRSRAMTVISGICLGLFPAVVVAALIDDRSRRPTPGAPQPVEPAFAVPEPELRPVEAHATQWAEVARRAALRRRPTRAAPRVALMSARTPEGTANVVQVLGRRRSDGRLWVKVRVPALPRGRAGWVPRAAIGSPKTVMTRLVVNRRRHLLRLLWRGREVFRAPVGVGAPASPTPAGVYYVRNRLTKYRSPFYGPVAFGTSARSAVLTDWPAGGFIGIHGTNRPGLIPGDVSHGCIRMRNADIRRLDRLMPIGTPVIIR
jgi:hypothetical protein